MKSQASVKNFEYPVIETDRLLLRMFDENDSDTAFQIFNDLDVQKYLSPKNRRTLEQVKILFQNSLRYWREKGFGLWCVTEKNVGQMIGYCGFQHFEKTDEVEIVFAYAKESWGRGFATEAAKACLNFGFEKLLLDEILAVTNPKNKSSIKVLEKSGMTFVKREFHYEMETVVYSISNSLT